MPESWLELLHLITGRLLGDPRLQRDPLLLLEELEAEGFDAGAVALALAWIERLCTAQEPHRDAGEPAQPFTSSGCRTRSAEEMHCLSAGAFGLLLKLENTGVIDAATREEILERALALGGEEVDEEAIRAISRDVLEASGNVSAAADPTGTLARGRRLH